MTARRRIADYLVYLLTRAVVCVVQALPPRRALALAGPLAWLWHRLDRRHRLVAADNLRQSFPHHSQADIAELVRRCYRHLAAVLVEMILLPRLLRRDNVAEHVRYREAADYERLRALYAGDRPLLLLTGHLGNWEVMSYAFGLAGYTGHVIARRLDNPHLDRFLRRFRMKTGQQVLCKNEDYAAVQAVLTGGGRLALLGDQDAGPRGVFVDFFGRPASTFKAIALLALEYRAVVPVLAAVRVGEPVRYQLLVADVIDAADYAGRADAVSAITQRYTAALEAMVRDYPEQYFWLHRRWKHQPRARSALRQR